MAEGDNQKTAAEIAAELQALTDKKKLTEEIKKLTEEQLKVLKEHSTLSEEIRARLEQLSFKTSRRVQAIFRECSKAWTRLRRK